MSGYHIVKRLAICAGSTWYTDLEIAPHHHLQHQEELSIRDVTIPVDVINFESDYNSKVNPIKCHTKSKARSTHISVFLRVPHDC
jgi:hypothetical protein